MTALNSEGLEKAIAQAIFDPGATEGYKGDRTLTEWQVQAVMRAITSHTPALPPVDGLEVVGHVKPDHPEVVDPLFVRELSQPWMDGIFTEPVVTLSQASSVIAGLTAERDAAQASAFVWENRFVLMDGAYNREFSRAQAAEARLKQAEDVIRPFAEIAPLVETTNRRDGERVHEQRRPDGTWQTLTRADFRAAAQFMENSNGQ